MDLESLKRWAELLPDSDKKALLESLSRPTTEKERFDAFYKIYQEQERRSQRSEMIGMLVLFMIGFAILYFPVRGIFEGKMLVLGNGTDAYLYWNEFPSQFVVLVAIYCAISFPFFGVGGFLLREKIRIAIFMKESRKRVEARRAQLRTPKQILDAPLPLYPIAGTPEKRAAFDRAVKTLREENAAVLAKRRQPSPLMVVLAFAISFMFLFITSVMVAGMMVLPDECAAKPDRLCDFQNWLYGIGGRPAVSIFWILVTMLTFSGAYVLYKQHRKS